MKHYSKYFPILFLLLCGGVASGQINRPYETFVPNPPGTPSAIPTAPSYSVNNYSTTYNYVRNWVPRKPFTSIPSILEQKVSVSTIYRNGFGASLQTIQHGAASRPDIIRSTT